MPTIKLTPALTAEYERLFDEIEMPLPVRTEASTSVEIMRAGQARYEAVAGPACDSWLLVGLLHAMESNADFTKHLHNGDPLMARTVHVPAGRPKTGAPPFRWEDSALDALRLHFGGAGFLQAGIGDMLYQLERWNGWGYRLYHPEVLSPYLWAGSQHYVSGKYGTDGIWKPALKSKQIGAAVILRRYHEMYPEEARLEESVVQWRYGDESEDIKALQRLLRVSVDGQAGPRTSDAFKRATGYYLSGDPRA